MTAEKEASSETNGKEEQEQKNKVNDDTKPEDKDHDDTSKPVDEDNEDTSKLESDIIRQVEFYFGDVNLGRDKFLREQVKLDDGWVPFETMIKFKRLANLSTDFDIIAAALKKSTSGLLEVSDDNKKVRRNPEMPVPEMNEERRKNILGRTVYAKGFPKDSTTLDDLLTYFKEQGETENVVMRRYVDKSSKTKKFKGSVFATFKTKEDAEKFLANKELKYSDTPLLTMWQEEYLQKKQEEYLEKKDKRSKEKKEVKKEEKEPLKLPTGTVLHIAQGNEKLKREDLHAAFTKLGAEIAYIDFKVGEKEGWVRLSKENQAKEVFEKITDGKLTIGETEVTVKLVEGEDETKYLDKSVEEMMKRRNKGPKNFQHKNKGRGKYTNRKRKQDNDGDAPPAKVKTNDS